MIIQIIREKLMFRLHKLNLCNLFKICVIFVCFQNLVLPAFIFAEEEKIPQSESSKAATASAVASTAKVSITPTPTDVTKLSLDNILGKDTSIIASGSLSEDYIHAKGGFEKRHVFGSPYFVGIDANGRSWNDIEFDLKGAGADVYFGRYITENIKATVKYRFDEYDVSDTDSQSAIDFSRHEGTNAVSALSLRLVRSTVDNTLYPTKGANVGLFGECALKGLGGDFNFSRLEAEGAYFFTPYKEITIGLHGVVGSMENFGGSQDVPFYERYFIGSGSTVRGFKMGYAGPISAQGTALGSDVEILGNVETRFPIYNKLKGVVFFDMGKGLNRVSDVSHSGLRESAGLGLRYLTPWVVVRADYGFVLDRRSGEKIGKLHMTVGMPF